MLPVARLTRIPPARRVAHELPAQGVNVAPLERLASTLAGGALLAWALRRSAPARIPAGAAASGLLARGLTGHCSLYDLLEVNTARRGAATAKDYMERGRQVREAITVARSPDEVYAFWRHFPNLVDLVPGLAAVELLDPRRSRWRATVRGREVTWESELLADLPGRHLAWQTLAGSDLQHAGSVTFRPWRDGTEVRLVVDYLLVSGRFGHAALRLAGRPPALIARRALQRVKQRLEVGEVALAGGQPHGRR